jgi:branched-subunit amino acid aminotransferase/4-amino-4-deoxychorismate lyase
MSSASTSSSPIAAARGPRPDPQAGVFETLLVVDGRPLELDAHLARLDDSLRALFGAGAPPDARRLVLDRARGHGLARLRLTATPDGLGAAVHEVAVAPVDRALVLPDAERAIELAPVVVAGGIGAHKWADRRLLAAADADAAPRVPLLVDRDGAVLEASRGNLFAVYDGVLVTPPADGRILPGVTRGRVLRLAADLGMPRREEPLAFDRLAAAEELFLTGAVRGIEPVRACDGAFTGSEHRTTAKLAQALRRSWEWEA